MKKKEKKLIVNILSLIAFLGGVTLIVISFLLPGKTYKGVYNYKNTDHNIAYEFSSNQVTQYVDDEKNPLLTEMEWRNEDGMIQVDYLIKWIDIGKPVGPVFATANPTDSEDTIYLLSSAAIVELVIGLVLVVGSAVVAVKNFKKR